ncbi:methyltransferase domain-containing protein [Candidatus Collierbacteria bacterium]|nr:methyltransferase domain-containing protein [Candidatus Collierbacteria bacterium]
MTKMVERCRICGSKELVEFLDLGEMPLPNAFLKSKQEKKTEKKFPLRVGFCPRCTLVQLLDIVDPELMFRNYVYIPSASKTRLDNFFQIAQEMIRKLPVKKNKLAVDIGSNDGSLLVEFKKLGVRTLGVDPAENLAKVAELKGVETLAAYFSPATAAKIVKKYGNADYITATNVVAHIEDLHGLFSGVKTLLSKNGLFVCEFPYLLDLVEKKYFDTIYHEHLSYFSAAAIKYLLDKKGLFIVDIRRTAIDGGALRITIAKDRADYIRTAAIGDLLKLEESFGINRPETYLKFGEEVARLGERLRKKILEIKSKRKSVVGYGASARGNILLNYCGIDGEVMDFIVDSTPYKQGLLAPGSHIPIAPEEAINNVQPDFAVILAWNFAEEIMEKQFKYLENGGKFIIPVPDVKVVSRLVPRRKTEKVILVMPAYNATKTLVDSYRKIPKKYVDEVILVDDSSRDDTYQVAKKLPITVFRNELNLGYGGNLKVCLTKALEAGADVIIEYHPDDQYDPSALPKFVEKVNEGYDFALGSRFIFPKTALKNKMPLVKFIANRAMSFIDELVLGLELSEFHSGFRMYTRKLLESVPWRQNSDDYLFSFDIITQAVYWDFKVAEVPISCRYHPAMHTANLFRSTIYALGTFKTLWQYLAAKFFRFQRGPFLLIQPAPCPKCGQKLTRFENVVKDGVSGEQFSVFFCTICQNGFTVPAPKDLSKYYPKTYYFPVKSLIYNLLQFRRLNIIRQYKKSGKLLDIGCGDGSTGSFLPEFNYTGIETSFSGAKNNNILIGGIEKVKISSATFDIATFWESLEHVSNPALALAKIFKSLKKKGILIIECPNYANSERLIFGSKWFHLDTPRHLTHFTPKGLAHLLGEVGFEVIEQRQLYAPEYIPVGLAQSIMYLISPRLNFVALTNNGPVSAILVSAVLLSLLIFTFPLSIVLYWLKASPILLTVARKH